MASGGEAGQGPTRPDGRPTLDSLQAMRGLAAIAVAIYHTHVILAQPEYGSILLFGPVAGLGWLGVNFFFLLSGFIIVYAHWKDVGRLSRLPAYTWRRISRVYPIYWIVLTAYIVAALAGIGHPDFERTTPHLLSSYLLVPLVTEPSMPLKVAWTLFYEVTFYALFPLGMINRWLMAALAALWLAGILVNSLLLGNTVIGPLNMWNVYFLAGAAIFFVSRAANRRAGPLLLAGGCLLLVAMVFLGYVPQRVGAAQDRPLLLLLLGIPFALILAGAAVRERTRVSRMPRALLLLGDASYAIYLVHSGIISVIAQIHHRFAVGQIPPAALFALTALAAVGAGIVVHLVIERPLLRRLRSVRGPDRHANALPNG